MKRLIWIVGGCLCGHSFAQTEPMSRLAVIPLGHAAGDCSNGEEVVLRSGHLGG